MTTSIQHGGTQSSRFTFAQLLTFLVIAGLRDDARAPVIRCRAVQRSDEHDAAGATLGTMNDLTEAEGWDWEVYTNQQLERNKRASEAPDSWWTSEGDLYQRVNEWRGLVLAQQAEAEGLLVEIVTLLILGIDPAPVPKTLLAEILDRRNASQLHTDVKNGLTALFGELDAQAVGWLKTIKNAVEARNRHAHRRMRVIGAGEWQRDDGSWDWTEGELEFDGEPYSLTELHADFMLARSSTVAALDIRARVLQRLTSAD